MKILVLEDEQRNAMRLIRLLNGIDTTFTIEGPLASIKETVEFFQSGKAADLILADIRLTDGLSFEALKYAPATVPIIFTTAYDEYAVQAFKFNSFDYLLKPVDADELEAAIDKAIKQAGIMPTRTFGSFSMPYRRTNSAIGNASYCPIVTAIRQFVSQTSTTLNWRIKPFTSASITELPKPSMCQWTNLNSNSTRTVFSVPTASTSSTWNTYCFLAIISAANLLSA